MARDNNNRITPDVVRDYNLKPTASIVDKQSKYNPQIEDSAKLKQTAEGLAKFAKGINDIRYIVERQANDNAIEAMAKTEEKNRKDFAEVCKNIKGMAKFNPYNKEAFYTLRAKEIAEQGVLKIKELKTICASLTPEEFEAQKEFIKQEIINNMGAENLQAKHTAGYLTGIHNQLEQLKGEYVTKNAEFNFGRLQNQIVTSISKDIARLTTDNPEGYLVGWNGAIKNLEDIGNYLGMNNKKQVELFVNSVNQYLTDNIDDIDAEEFMIGISQTKINGTPLSDYDPNYATSIKQLLTKAKQAKYELDSTDLKVEKLRLEKAELAVNAEMLSFMADPNKTDSEILNKAYSLIEENQMEGIGMAWLHKVAGDKQTLLNLRTAQTDPTTYNGLIQHYIAGDLTQGEILQASEEGKLNPKDAYNLFNSLKMDDRREFNTTLTYMNKRYLSETPDVDLGTDANGKSNKEIISKAVFDIVTDTSISKNEQQKRLAEAQRVAEFMEEQQKMNKSADPMKLLRKEYLKTQRVETQSVQDAQRAIAKMGLFKNQFNLNDTNIQVTSAMQKDRSVTLSDGTQQTANHTGTDIKTYTGRRIIAPATGIVVASGYEKSLGNYVLFKYEGGGYIKLLHLQQANLPKAGDAIIKGATLAHVGNSGNVTTKDTGILHIECFDKRMRLVNPEQFLKGK